MMDRQWWNKLQAEEERLRVAHRDAVLGDQDLYHAIAQKLADIDGVRVDYEAGPLSAEEFYEAVDDVLAALDALGLRIVPQADTTT